MSTLIFIAGMGAGAFIVVLCALKMINAGIKGRNDAQKACNEFNERNLAALQERNQIGRENGQWLREIAANTTPK